MVKKKGSSFTKRYQSSYESKDKGGFTKASVLDFKKVDDDVTFYTPIKGRNRINIIPYEIKTKNHPLVKRGEMEVGDMDYVMDVWVHRSVGPTEGNVLCLKNTFGKPCPICELANKLKKEGKDDEAKDLRASRRVYYNVQDMKEPDKVKVFETSHYLFEKELIDEARDDEEGGFIDFADPVDGKEIKFRANETSLGSNKYLEYKSFSFEDREEEIGDDLLESAISFDEILNIPTYDEVEKLLYGNDDDKDDEDDDDEPVKKSSKKAYDDDDEDDEEDDEEEDEEPKPSKKASKKSTYVDDDDEDEPAPPKKSSKKRDDDDEDDEDEKPRGKCKFGHKFGKDCEKFDDCDDCDLWDKCVKAN